jgi:hypothetical protein
MLRHYPSLSPRRDFLRCDTTSSCFAFPRPVHLAAGDYNFLVKAQLLEHKSALPACASLRTPSWEMSERGVHKLTCGGALQCSAESTWLLCNSLYVRSYPGLTVRRATKIGSLWDVMCCISDVSMLVYSLKPLSYAQTALVSDLDQVTSYAYKIFPLISLVILDQTCPMRR